MNYMLREEAFGKVKYLLQNGGKSRYFSDSLRALTALFYTVLLYRLWKKMGSFSVCVFWNT